MAEKFVFVGTHSQFNEAMQQLIRDEDFDKNKELEEGHFLFEVSVVRKDPTEAVAKKTAPSSVKSK